MTPPTKKAILGAALASYPLQSGGVTWAYLQWALSLREAGYDVWLVETLEAKKVINAERETVPFVDSASARHWNDVAVKFGFKDRATVWVDGVSHGAEGFADFARGADLFINVSGHFKRLDLLEHVPVRVYLDLDPVFTQIWAEDYGIDMNFAGHTHFFTVGMNLPGNPDCPQAGQVWHPTLFPVALNHWPAQPAPAPEAAWTTMTHWYGYPPVQHNNEWYDNKSEEFVKLREVASTSPRALEIATDLVEEDNVRGMFEQMGWRITKSAPLSEPWTTYPDFLRGSFGEFSAAKNGYVKSGSGWFSDRSACYLALGRPVILQETGWSRFLPEGEGLLGFGTLEEALEKLHEVERDPERHQKAARRIAEEHLAGPKVIRDFLSRL
jgi:hypothetical protein